MFQAIKDLIQVYKLLKKAKVKYNSQNIIKVLLDSAKEYEADLDTNSRYNDPSTDRSFINMQNKINNICSK